MEEIGNVEYVMLTNAICNDSAGTAGSSTFTWKMPYIKPQESPIMYIQACQIYLDCVSNTQAPPYPYHLRLKSTLAENYYCNDSQNPIVSFLVYDGIVGHSVNPNNNPILQISTKESYLTFEIVANLSNLTLTMPANGSLNIMLKIIRPKQMEMTKNNIATYARMLP